LVPRVAAELVALASAAYVAMVSTRIPVWLDCDPGHDDAMAIVLAGECDLLCHTKFASTHGVLPSPAAPGWSPKLHLLGISTVAGNQTVEKVTQNALDTCDLAGLDTCAHKALSLCSVTDSRTPEQMPARCCHVQSQLAGHSHPRPSPLCRCRSWSSEAPDAQRAHPVPRDTR
jgi:hypothetical protein